MVTQRGDTPGERRDAYVRGNAKVRGIAYHLPHEPDRRPPFALPVRRPRASIGPLLRTWRQRRRLSQMALALDADVSARHLSVESGRAQPSREMVLHLAERLDAARAQCAARRGRLRAAVPRTAVSDPQLDAARHAVEAVLRGHEPYPALAVDRHWTLLAANRMLGALVAQADPALLQPPSTCCG